MADRLRFARRGGQAQDDNSIGESGSLLDSGDYRKSGSKLATVSKLPHSKAAQERAARSRRRDCQLPRVLLSGYWCQDTVTGSIRN